MDKKKTISNALINATLFSICFFLYNLLELLSNKSVQNCFKPRF